MSLQDSSHPFSVPAPEPHAPKQPVSESKILANRKNSLRSTGPKTLHGKRNVARNAMKHGIFAREVVITAGDGEESLEEFHALVEGLMNFYEPVGTMEEMLVETIVSAVWGKARVLRAENGEIRKQLDTSAADRMLRNSDKGNFDQALSEMGLPLYSAENQTDQKVATMDRLSAMQVAQSNLREHQSGLEYMSVLLERAKSEIQDYGISEAQTIYLQLVETCHRGCVMSNRATPPNSLACIPHALEPHWDNVWAPRPAGFPVNIVYAPRIEGVGLAQATYGPNGTP